MTIPKAKHTTRTDTIRPEYNLRGLKGGIRGKYYSRSKAASNIVVIDPELATIFPNSDSVNEALRTLVSAASQVVKKHQRVRRSRSA